MPANTTCETLEVEESPILFVGLICVDVLFQVECFPMEDSDQRCEKAIWARGGNASNNCTVFSLLGAPCEFFGTIATSPEKTFLEEDLKKHGIKCSNMVYKENTQCPTSFCIISKENGTRTIIHSRGSLPELCKEEFTRIDLKSGGYRWIHFEGRPRCDQIKAMLQRVDEYNKTVGPEERITTSVEMEKPREHLLLLQDMADYVFISKDVARLRGFSSAGETVTKLRSHCRPGATVICPWGEEGACGIGPDGVLVNAKAYPPEKLINTLGAGDTFNSSVIYALSRGKCLKDALDFGCFIAGAKCGMMDFSGIKKLQHPFINGTSQDTCF